MPATNPSILIFLDWFTPGYKAGGPISSNANLIAHLAESYQFHIITRDTDYCETIPYASVDSNQWTTMPQGSTVYYISADRLNRRNLLSITKQVQFDTVYINGIYSWYFSLLPLLYFKYFTHKKVVVAARGMLSDHTFSVRKRKKKLFYACSRLLGLYSGITFHATNADEAEQIRRNVGFKGTIHIAPNLPPKATSTQVTPATKVPGQLKLVSIARISHEKNTLYALEMLEKVSQNRLSEPFTDIVFDLYGTIYSDHYLAQCLAVIKRLPATVTVTIKGSIAKEKINETLTQYHFLFMPTQGENYGHAIVESMLAGCPVIISDRTPWRNLSTDHTTIGWDIALDQPEEFVKVIHHCAGMGQKEYSTISKNAFGYILEKTNDPAVLEASREMFKTSTLEKTNRPRRKNNLFFH